MVSCTCQRSVYSQLPFDQCTPENGGCRVCPAGQYQVFYCLSAWIYGQLHDVGSRRTLGFPAACPAARRAPRATLHPPPPYAVRP